MEHLLVVLVVGSSRSKTPVSVRGVHVVESIRGETKGGVIRPLR